jgi:hypothetical protein
LAPRRLAVLGKLSPHVPSAVEHVPEVAAIAVASAEAGL